MVEPQLPEIPQGIMIEMEGSGEAMDQRVQQKKKIGTKTKKSHTVVFALKFI